MQEMQWNEEKVGKERIMIISRLRICDSYELRNYKYGWMDEKLNKAKKILIFFMQDNE